MAATIPAGCTASKKAAKNPAPDFTIFLQRTPCKGPCPYYNFTVNAKGQVLYEGKSFTDKIGIYQKQLKPKTVKALASAIERTPFWSWNPLYDNPGIADLPGVLLSVTHRGRTHQVLSRIGAPEAFEVLVAEIEGLVGESGYKKISDLPY